MTTVSSMTTNRAAGVDAGAIVDFLRHEMALLDQRRFEEWMELYAEDGFYWAPVDPDQKDPKTHVSLFYDDKKAMQTRIDRLRHPRIHSQIPPSRTVHLASNVEISDGPNELIPVTCNFIMLEYRPTRGQNIWGGTYEYELIPSNGGNDYNITAKIARLVSSDDQFPSLAVWF